MTRTVDIDNIDLKSLRLEAGLTQSQLGAIIGLSQSQTARTEQDPTSATISTLKKWVEACGYIAISGRKAMDNLYSTLYYAKSTLVKNITSIECADSIAQSDPTCTPIELINSLSESGLIPTLSCFGPFDSGKSTLLNMLLGDRVLPTGWQPVTSAVVILNHISRRPVGLKHDVFFLGKQFDIGNRHSTQHITSSIIIAGSLDSLHENARHESFASSQFDDSDDWGSEPVESRKPIAQERSLRNIFKRNHNPLDISYALVYIDAPLLNNVELVDTPGFGKTPRDTELARIAMSHCDIGVICHGPQNFCDVEYIGVFEALLRTLPKINNRNILKNLLLPITHANPGIQNEELKRIRESAGAELAAYCESHPMGFIKARTGSNNYTLSAAKDLIKSRVFPYYANDSVRGQHIGNEISEILLTVYPQIRKDELGNLLQKISKKIELLVSNAESRLNNIKAEGAQISQRLADIKAKRHASSEDRAFSKKRLCIDFSTAQINVLNDWSNMSTNCGTEAFAEKFVRQFFSESQKELAQKQAGSLYQAETESQLAASFARNLAPVQLIDAHITKSYSNISDFVRETGAVSVSALGFIADPGKVFRRVTGMTGGYGAGYLAAINLLGTLASGSALALATIFTPAVLAIIGATALVVVASKIKSIFTPWQTTIAEKLASDFKKSSITSDVNTQIRKKFSDMKSGLEIKYGPFSNPTQLSEGELDKSEVQMIAALEEQVSLNQSERIQSALNHLDACKNYRSSILHAIENSLRLLKTT